jgi:hypothetical protein
MRARIFFLDLLDEGQEENKKQKKCQANYFIFLVKYLPGTFIFGRDDIFFLFRHQQSTDGDASLANDYSESPFVDAG